MHAQGPSHVTERANLSYAHDAEEFQLPVSSNAGFLVKTEFHFKKKEKEILENKASLHYLLPE